MTSINGYENFRGVKVNADGENPFSVFYRQPAAPAVLSPVAF
jgi:hypothetical protein